MNMRISSTIKIESWDCTMPVMPERSRLLRMQPIGIGTSMVEHLDSYLSRLAYTYHVKKSTLINEELLPLLINQNSRNESVIPPVKRIYSSNIYHMITCKSHKGRAVCEALEMVNGQENMQSLTMKAWVELIQDETMIKTTKEWCPDCLSEWKKSGQTIYEPLLWLVDGVTVCGIHRRYLEHICPNCKNSVEFKDNCTLPGYCAHCGSWLCNTKSKKRLKSIPEKELSQAIWQYESVGRLIEASASASTYEKAKVGKGFKKYVQDYYDDDIARFAHEIGWTRQESWGIYVEYYKMNLSDIISLCRRHYFDIVKFILEGRLKQIEGEFFSGLRVPILRTQNNVTTRINLNEVRKRLRSYLEEAGQVVPSVENVARQLRCPTKNLLAHFPSLCKKITHRYMKSLKIRRIANINRSRDIVRSQTIELFVKGSVPAQEYIISRLENAAPWDAGKSYAKNKFKQKEYGRMWYEREVKGSWYETLHELGIKPSSHVICNSGLGAVEEIPYKKLAYYPPNGFDVYERIEQKYEGAITDYRFSRLARV